MNGLEKIHANLIWTRLLQMHSPICIRCRLDVLPEILVGYLERDKDNPRKKVC